MSVRLNTGHGVHADGFVFEDFEAIPIGQIDTLPQVTGNNRLVLRVGHSIPRQG
jgi:hypothetical protein